MRIEATPVHRIVSAIYVHWICPMQNAKRAVWERNNQHLWAKLCVLRQLLALSTKLLVNKIARVASVLLVVYVFTYKAYERCIFMLNFPSYKSVKLTLSI